MCTQYYKLIIIFFFICFHGAAQKSISTDSAKRKSVISPIGFKTFEKNASNQSVDKILDSLKEKSNYDSSNAPEEYKHAYWQYEIQALDNRRRVFEWQLSSSRYIFLVVIAVVTLGLLLSFWQFYLPIYRYNKFIKTHKDLEGKQMTEENKEAALSTLKLGKDGIEITSSVIGLLILFISIAFFFLYLNYVYPISEINH